MIDYAGEIIRIVREWDEKREELESRITALESENSELRKTIAQMEEAI